MVLLMANSVLIVDDDPVILLLLRVNFEMEGFRVVTAEDGEIGLSSGRAEDFDLVLLDVMMPKLDGYQVLEALRSDGNVKPIVLLSGNESAESRDRGMELGATAYITKPFDPATLLESMKQLLATKS